MVLLKVLGVDCYYESKKVLDGISFSIEEGDFVGLLGPNASGKTTLLRALSRSLRPKVGAVYLNEREIYEMDGKEVARNVAVVPQDTGVHFDLTALDVVLMGRYPHLERFKGEGRRDIEIARRAMEITDTWELAERPISELSGGERQKVMIARALTQEPKVLLLDEPTSHLDIKNQLEIMDLLRSLSVEKGMAVLSVLHDFNLASRYCDSLILIGGGRIVSIGSVDEVLTRENIREVYGVDVIVKRHPITGTLYVLPAVVPKPREDGPLIHVVCGGGSGSELMRRLVGEGFRVSVGVINALDTDHETAKLLGLKAVVEAPFSPISDEAQRENLELVKRADAVVLSPTCFGVGNLKNLEAVRYATRRGIRVYLMGADSIEERDYTGGKAASIYRELEGMGARAVGGIEELVEELKSLRRGGSRGFNANLLKKS